MVGEANLNKDTDKANTDKKINNLNTKIVDIEKRANKTNINVKTNRKADNLNKGIGTTNVDK